MSEEKECCGNCDNEGEMTKDRARQILDAMAQDIGKLNAMVVALVRKAGGEVEVSDAEAKEVGEYVISVDRDDDRGVFIFKSVSVVSREVH